MSRLASFALIAFATTALAAPVRAAEIDFSASRETRTAVDPTGFNNSPLVTLPISGNLEIRVNPALGDTVTLGRQALGSAIFITGTKELGIATFSSVDLRLGDMNDIVATGGTFANYTAGPPLSTDLRVSAPFLGLSVGDTVTLTLTSFHLTPETFFDGEVGLPIQVSDVAGRITGNFEVPAPNPAPVPEPASLLLFALGGVAATVRRKSR